jgi:RNA polymerase sigma factor (sigma-70 family)
MTPEDSADVFQAVWIDLYHELPRLRRAGSLRAWLLTVAAHKAFRLKRSTTARGDLEGTALDEAGAFAVAPTQPDPIEESEREQTIREAIAELTPRCREMIRLLFYEQPPRPYAAVAAQLGLAVGSIGFIRGRCLQRLQRYLRDAGL